MGAIRKGSSVRLLFSNKIENKTEEKTAICKMSNEPN